VEIKNIQENIKILKARPDQDVNDSNRINAKSLISNTEVENKSNNGSGQQY
jgi:hypothetical protein